MDREQNSAKNRIAVVIPGHDCQDVTIKCLESLPQHIELVVYVDNGSSTLNYGYICSKIQRLPQQFRYVVHRFEKNQGFTRAVNAGLQIITKNVVLDDMLGVLFLNNDCFVNEQAVSDMVQYLQRNPECGIVGARAATDTRPFERFVSMVPFYCALIRTECLTDVGMLDETFEDGLGADDDYCIRARQRGWEMAFVLSRVHHLGGYTFDAYNIPRDSELAMAKLRVKYANDARHVATMSDELDYNTADK